MTSLGDPPLDLRTMMLGGVAVVVATADQDARPSLTRGWGPLYEEKSARLSLAVTAPAGSSTLLNLEASELIAVTVSHPVTYQTVQMKGSVRHIGAPSAQDRDRVDVHLSRFASEVAKLGLTEGIDGLFLGDLRLVSFIVDELYEQTPGINAGVSLK